MTRSCGRRRCSAATRSSGNCRPRCGCATRRADPTVPVRQQRVHQPRRGCGERRPGAQLWRVPVPRNQPVPGRVQPRRVSDLCPRDYCRHRLFQHGLRRHVHASNGPFRSPQGLKLGGKHALPGHLRERVSGLLRGRRGYGSGVFPVQRRRLLRGSERRLQGGNRLSSPAPARSPARSSPAPTLSAPCGRCDRRGDFRLERPKSQRGGGRRDRRACHLLQQQLAPAVRRQPGRRVRTR